jgi:anaerobic magnesium-protoporphyrin IX monomethyl ester cyclase
MKISLVSIQDNSQNNLSLLYLAAYVRHNLSDVEFEVLEHEDPISIMRRTQPDIVGITTYSFTYGAAIKLCKEIKSALPGTLVILGGHHISAMPDSLPADADLAVMGEGEVTFLNLVREYKDKGTIDKLTQLGIAYRDSSGTLVVNDPQPPIPDLDLLPLPAYDLIMDRAQPVDGPTGKKITLPLSTSRGCCFKCKFCASTHFWGKMRFFSSGYVIRNIEKLIELGAARISIVDDYFTLPKSRFDSIYSRVMEKRYNTICSFRCFLRCDAITEGTARQLKAMNFETVCLGIEFGSQRNLDYVNKQSKVEDNSAGLSICRKVGLKTFSGFIVGVPGETEQDIQMTYDFIKKSPIDSPALYIIIPYPGTALHEELKPRYSNKLSDNSIYYSGLPYNVIHLLFTRKLRIPEVWTNSTLSQEIYRKWIIKLLRLIFIKNLAYFFRRIVDGDIGVVYAFRLLFNLK